MNTLRLVVIVGAAVVSAGCGASSVSSQPGATPTARDCTTLRFPYPDADVTLSEADSGHTATIHPGGLVELDLLGASGKHWTPIQLTGTGVQSLGTQAMTPTVGSQLGEYCGVAAGTVTLSSRWESGSWTATIKVQ